MSIGEVLVVVRSMNGGDVTGDTDALSLAISEAHRIGFELSGSFSDAGAKGVGVEACRDAGDILGWNLRVRTERPAVGRDSASTARGIVGATVGREPDLVSLQGLQTATIRSYLEQTMNSTYTYPITGINVSTERELRDADKRMATLSSFATTHASGAITASVHPSASVPSTTTAPNRISPVTHTDSSDDTTTSGNSPAATARQTITGQPHTRTTPNTTTTTDTSPNTARDTTNTTTRQQDTNNVDDRKVAAARDTTSPTASPNNAAPNTPGPNTGGPHGTGPGDRSLNLSAPLSLPGLNTPTGTPGSPTSTPRTINGPVTPGGPRTTISPRGAGPVSTTTGTPPTSTVPGTTRPTAGGTVPPGARSAGSREGDGRHTVAGYLRAQGNGAEAVGSLPLVSPPVLGDWSAGPETAERDDDSGTDDRDR